MLITWIYKYRISFKNQYIIIFCLFLVTHKHECYIFFYNISDLCEFDLLFEMRVLSIKI
jgi:hypothetical protein